MAFGFRQPAEWEPHAAVWSAWPSDASLWEEGLQGAREEFTAMCEAIADCDPISGKPRGEPLKILASGDEAVESAKAALDSLRAEVVPLRFGDIWLRDTAPIFVRNADGKLATRLFGFNGWGGKYELPGDENVGPYIAERVRLPSESVELIFEGGSIDVDGQGNAITTRECLLNPNRNPGLSVDAIEALLCPSLGIENLIWLDRGLINDHTDGHLDNIARFVGPEKVACMKPNGDNDPNAGTYLAILQTLSHARTLSGKPLEVVEIPSPGRVLDADGNLVPASHLNFYISNTRVVVPFYETVEPEVLVEAFAPLFPTREIVVIAAHAILTGGGSFHCITQQMPSGA